MADAASASSFDLTIRGGCVVTEDDEIIADIGIKAGKIAAVAPSPSGMKPGAQDIDASGLLVLPGGVDSHCHIEQKTSTGLTPSDDFYSASVSALCGGTTTIIPFACQHRGDRIRDVVTSYRTLAAKAACDYAIHIIVSDPAVQHAVEDLKECFEQGYTSVKVYMTYDALKLRDEELLDVLDLCRQQAAMVMVHAESHDLIAWITRRLLSAGLKTPKYHAVARHPLAEREAAHRAITFAEFIGTPLLIVHVSGHEAVREIARARERGLPIFGETCPQYLVLTKSCLDHPHDEWQGAKYLCSPPLRCEKDQCVLWSALRLGQLQVVSSDHSAYNFQGSGASKMMNGSGSSFAKVPMGLPGLEARLMLLYTGVHEKKIDLRTFVNVSSTNPAKLYGLYPQKGVVKVGSDADLAIWDPKRDCTLSTNSLHDDLDYTPYEGRVMHGCPVATVIRGKVVFRKSDSSSTEDLNIVRDQGKWYACGKPNLLGWSGPWPNELDCVLEHAGIAQSVKRARILAELS